MAIGEYQAETLLKHAKLRRAGWTTVFRIRTYRPYTREFGGGWPIYIISTHPQDPNLKIRDQLSLLKHRENAYGRIDEFKKFIEECEK